MIQIENLTKKPLFTDRLAKRMMIGAAIGLVMVSFFVIVAGKGRPEWGDYWRIKPLLLTPLLGAIVGLCYDVTEPLRQIKGLVHTSALIFRGLSRPDTQLPWKHQTGG
jgi:hypothetical protein